MNVSALDDFVASIAATGDNGFEGLIAYLCEKATGQSFRLSGSGQQGGQDARTEPCAGNCIKVETKRYSEAKLNRRELIAEVVQATSNDHVDLWVLVASCSVIDQTAKEIEEIAQAAGAEVVFIDKGVSGLQRLWVLMAAHSQAVEQWVSRHAASMNTAPALAALRSVRDHVDYDDVWDALLTRLTTTAVGFDDARRRLSRSLEEVLVSQTLSNALFQQDWAIDAKDVHVVPRLTVNQQLDSWWASVASGELPRAVVLGEEGVGKSWAAMGWIKQRLADDATMVIPISCATEAIAPSETLETLLPRVIAARTGVRDAEFWQRRILRWLSGSARSPSILIVLDGLNEKPEHRWRGWLSTLDKPHWTHAVGILATDRPGHWFPHCANAGVLGFQEVTVDGYNDPELALALRDSPLVVSELPADLMPLVRKPRYCQLVLQHCDDLVRESDFTVERLIYLDAQYRCANHPTFPLIGDEFIAMIRKLASEYRDSPEFDRVRIADNIPWADKNRNVYEEIVSGGLMEPRSDIPGTFRVERKRLVFGLGMLLAEVVRLSVERSESRLDARETIERWFEPHPEMSLKVDIAGSAMFHSLLHKGFPSLALQEIIRYWLGLRNRGDRAQSAFTDYVRRCPEDFLAVAEGFWSSDGDRGVAQDYLARAFLKHRDDPLVQTALSKSIARWMGFVHADGPRISWSDREEERRKRRQEIEDRAGQTLVPGPIVVHGEELTVVEDIALLRMSRFAILLMSGGSRAPFIDTVMRWAIASAVMGSATESREVAWLLRLADDDCDELLLPHILTLLESASPVAVTAGHTVLHCLGGVQAKELAQALPRPESAGELALRKRHVEDPCNSLMPWTDGECLQCMDRTDIGLHWVLGRLGDRLLDPSFEVSDEFYKRVIDAIPEPPAKSSGGYKTEFDRVVELLTPVLARRNPGRLAELRRTAIRSQLSRPDESKELSIMRLDNYSLIVDESIVEQVLKAMTVLSEQANTWTDEGSSDQRFAEAQLFLGILPCLSAERGLRTLLNRPAKALDLLTLQYWFAELLSENASSALFALRSESEPRQLVRMLWYLSGHRYKFEADDIDCIAELARHDDWRVKGAAMQLACRADNPELSCRILSSTGAFLSTKPLWEMQQGAALVIASADALSIEEASKMLHPNAISYFVARRGNTESDIELYCEILDRTIAKIVGSTNVDRSLPAVHVPGKSHGLSSDYPDFVDNSTNSVEWRDGTTTWTSGRDDEDQPAGLAALFSPTSDDDRNRLERERVESVFAAWDSDAYQWFGRRFNYDALAALCQQNGDVVETWVRPALDDTPTGRVYRTRLGAFLFFLCPGLFDSCPDLGLQLWRTLRDDRSSVSVFDAEAAAFRASDNPQSIAARDELLDMAWSDADIAKLAYFAELHGRSSWLDSAVNGHIASSRLHAKAKGLTLASFSCKDLVDFRASTNIAEIDNTWVAEIVVALEKNIQLNENAKHWYKAFVTADNWDAAWSALELTLACADERFYLWQDSCESIGGFEVGRKHQFIESHLERIEKKLNRDSSRSKTLFGLKTSKNELLPFIAF